MTRKMIARLGGALAFMLAVCLPLVASAQQGMESPVQASLVSAQTSVQPGQPFTVALRMQHQTHWHSFWKNAGTGLPTKLKWELPARWKVSPIDWPVPTLVLDKTGEISGHGYVGVAYLPMTITPPANAAAGSTIALKATARWLMCDTICIPGKQDVSLSLPVSAKPTAPDASVAEAIAAMPMPQSAADWKLAASKNTTEVTLHVAAPDAVSDLHFYPEEKFIAYKQPQTVASRGQRAMLKIAMDPEEIVPADERLRGVLAYTDGNGAYRGVKVDLPFSNAADAALISAMPADAIGPVSTAGASGATTSLSFGVLLLALLGGLILNLMPCVFPVLGIKVLGFIDQAGKDRRKVAAHAWSFSGGVLLSFWALAGVLAVLRAGGQQLGWGFQLQSAPFVFVLAVVMLVFALNLSGVFEIGMRATSVGSKLQSRSGISGSFFSGILATLVATPCSAPFLAPALGAALALPTLPSFVVFTVIAIGLSLPYLLLSVFPGLLRWLPRPGAWMETFKQAMAFPLYATVGYLIWVLAGQASEYGLLNALIAFSVVALALWVYGRFGSMAASASRRRIAIVAGVLLFAFGLGMGWPRAAAPDAMTWEAWSPERVAQLQKEGRGIYVDFTARWCATCQVNKKVVFGNRKVTDYFHDQNIVALKADWTNADPKITEALAKWGRSAVPFNLVYPAGAGTKTPIEMPELLTPKIVLDAFQHPAGAAP